MHKSRDTSTEYFNNERTIGSHIVKEEIITQAIVSFLERDGVLLIGSHQLKLRTTLKNKDINV